MSKRITGKLPAPTMAQRLASMSSIQLADAARELAKSSNDGADVACTAVLEALEGRLCKTADGRATFETFVEEIYS